MSWRADAPRRARAAGQEAKARPARPGRGGVSVHAMAHTLAVLLGYLAAIFVVCYLVAFVAFTLAVVS